MKAIQIQDAGGPEVLELADLPIPQPGPGQVLIRIEATGVNFIEIYFRKGVYKASFPMIPGSEAAGTMEELGPGVTGFKAGDAVVSVSCDGQLRRIRACSRSATGQDSRRAQAWSRPPPPCCRA